MLLLEPVENSDNSAVPMHPGWLPDEMGFHRARTLGMSDEDIVDEIKQFRRHHLSKRTVSYRWDHAWFSWCLHWRLDVINGPDIIPGSTDADVHPPMTFREFVLRYGYSPQIDAICGELGQPEKFGRQAWSKFVTGQLKKPPVTISRWPAIFRQHLIRRNRA